MDFFPIFPHDKVKKCFNLEMYDSISVIALSITIKNEEDKGQNKMLYKKIKDQIHFLNFFFLLNSCVNYCLDPKWDLDNLT